MNCYTRWRNQGPIRPCKRAVPSRHVFGSAFIENNVFDLPQFGKSMLGGRSRGAAKDLWDHCLQLPEWEDHPAFCGDFSGNDTERDSG